MCRGDNFMKRIGVLFGVENSFPSALVERINARNPSGIQAEFVQTGAVDLNQKPGYTVILDRISHEIPFYRAFLKNAALNGTVVINNPFWCSADDKFFNYALAVRLGVAVPPTVLLPHKEYPNGTTSKSLRNLEFPLDWDGVFAAIGEHGFLKPIHGGGWRDVQEVRGRDEFFRAYDQSRQLCMVAQKAIEYTEYFRCFVLGAQKVRIMPYDPRRPHAERYLEDAPRARTLRAKRLFRRMEEDALKLCRALGYDLNSVEFAVENGIPYAIDFLNPVPDADVHSVGAANFEWIVDQVANLAITRANASSRAAALRWPEFLRAAKPANPRVAKARTSTTPKRNTRSATSALLDATLK
jgi:glutathione synthase/RimK-type ligase-like ATP-grasp enzyme